MNHEQTQADLELLLDWIDALRRCPGRQPGAIRQRGSSYGILASGTHAELARRTCRTRAWRGLSSRAVLTERLHGSYCQAQPKSAPVCAVEKWVLAGRAGSAAWSCQPHAMRTR